MGAAEQSKAVLSSQVTELKTSLDAANGRLQMALDDAAEVDQMRSKEKSLQRTIKDQEDDLSAKQEEIKELVITKTALEKQLKETNAQFRTCQQELEKDRQKHVVRPASYPLYS